MSARKAVKRKSAGRKKAVETARKRVKSDRNQAKKRPTKRKRGRGRPLKLSAEVRDKVVDAIRLGNYPEVAARHAGIGKSTFYRYLAQGRDEDLLNESERTEMWEFWDAVTRAEADAEVHAVAQLLSHSSRDTKATVEFLRRRFRERWGVEIHELRRPGEGEKIGLEAIRSLLSPEEQDQMDKELANIGE